MSGTVLEHPLVRDYLRRLRAADDEVRAELARLGPPAALAAAAAGPASRAPGIRLLRRLARLGGLARLHWRAWASVAVVLALLAGAGVYVILVTSAAPLYLGGLGTWWFPRDGARAVVTTAGNLTQSTVPERYGQRQGFVVGITNDSDWTQTVLGVDPGSQVGGMIETVAVGAGPQPDRGGFPDDQTRWSLPGAIPPHSYRVLRVLWTSYTCLHPGGSAGIGSLGLRVRVGIITRTEVIPLDYVWAIAGTKTSHPARYCH